MKVSFFREKTLKKGNIRIEDSRLYLFSLSFLFLFSFLFIFLFLDLRLRVNMMLQTIIQCDTISYECKKF